VEHMARSKPCGTRTPKTVKARPEDIATKATNVILSKASITL